MHDTVRRGFTLIELLVTLSIVAMLALLAAPVAETAVQRSKEAELRRALREIRDAIDAYKLAVDEGRVARTPQDSGYPKTLRALVEGVEDARSPTKAKIYFLRHVPFDPMTATDNGTNSDADADAEKSWGKRAYASEPNEPKEGDDIYDVHSSSKLTGLNGVPYAKW